LCDADRNELNEFGMGSETLIFAVDGDKLPARAGCLAVAPWFIQTAAPKGNPFDASISRKE
jgi:hypothetical protein